MPEKKIVKLSAYDQALLRRCNNLFLDFLISISEHKYFDELLSFISEVEDLEKNIFFAEKEDKITPELLSTKHAYARGKIAGLKNLVYLFVGAKDEFDRRKEETKRKREAKKIAKEG